MNAGQENQFTLSPVGRIKNIEGTVYVEIAEAYIPALKELEHFSHAHLLWWERNCRREDRRTVMQHIPPYEQAELTGVFASRSPVRPNPDSIQLPSLRIVNSPKARMVTG